MSLYKIGKINPDYEKELRTKVFESAVTTDGKYVCADCVNIFPNRIPMQVDHIIPLNKGGKTVPENLQILCKYCNSKKGDR